MSLELLVLVRHAESQRNAVKEGLLFFPDEAARAGLRGVGNHKIAITERGWKQAEATGTGLREAFLAFDAVYHSGYRRTVETTEGILRAFEDHPKARKNMFLRERDAGYAYDMTTAEADAAFPWLREYWRTAGAFYAVPPGGESVAHVCERTQLFLNEVQQEQHRKVLVVSHGITIRAFRHLIEGWADDFEERFAATAPKNCAVTWYQKSSDGRLQLGGENQIYWSE